MNKTLPFALMALCVVACKEDKKESFPPYFSGFKAVSASANQIPLQVLTAGDSIIISAVQSSRGVDIYDATYDWTLRFTSDDGKLDTVMTKKESNIVYDVTPDDPTVRMRLFNVPGRLAVEFKAEYQYSDYPAKPVSFSQGGFTVTGSTLLCSASGRTSYTVLAD